MPGAQVRSANLKRFNQYGSFRCLLNNNALFTKGTMHFSFPGKPILVLVTVTPLSHAAAGSTHVVIATNRARPSCPQLAAQFVRMPSQ